MIQMIKLKKIFQSYYNNKLYKDDSQDITKENDEGAMEIENKGDDDN